MILKINSMGATRFVESEYTRKLMYTLDNDPEVMSSAPRLNGVSSESVIVEIRQHVTRLNVF